MVCEKRGTYSVTTPTVGFYVVGFKLLPTYVPTLYLRVGPKYFA